MFRITSFEKNGQSYPMIELKKSEDDKFPFNFGLAKAKLIVKHFEQIKNFVDQSENDGTNG